MPPPNGFFNEGKLCYLPVDGWYCCASSVCLPSFLLPPTMIKEWSWIVAAMKSRALSIFAICNLIIQNYVFYFTCNFFHFIFYRRPWVAIKTFHRRRFRFIAFRGIANNVNIISMYSDCGRRPRYFHRTYLFPRIGVRIVSFNQF